MILIGLNLMRSSGLVLAIFPIKTSARRKEKF